MAKVGLGTKGLRFDCLERQKNVWVWRVKEQFFLFPLHLWLK